MSMLRAFLGQDDIREAALIRLDARLQAKSLTNGALFWNGKHASVAAALIESGDAQAWQDRLGLAKWIAYAIDMGSSMLPPVKAAELAGALLRAVPVDSDTTVLGSRVIDAVLSKVAQSASADAANQTLEKVCSAIRSLHGAVLAGDPPASQAWRVARKAATAATNAVQGDRAKALGECIEAAAWDPVSAPTTVGDVLRLWISANASNADEGFGWTEEDERRTRELLSEMQETYIANHPEEKRDVFMLLRAHHPAHEARLLAYTQYRRAAGVRSAEQGGALLVETLRTWL